MYRQISLQDVKNSELHKPYLYMDELKELEEKYPDFPCYYTALTYGDEHWRYWNEIYTLKKDRRGEIAVHIKNSKNDVLLHTKPFYPEGSYRIPTGGIKFGERVLAGLAREIYEETSFAIVEAQFSGLLLYEFQHKGESLPFSTYLFSIRPDKEEPVVQDLTENISGFKWVDKNGLQQTIQQLLSLTEGRWPDWGKMRAIPHQIILEKCL